MSEGHSVSKLLDALRGGEDEAAREIWECYFEKLLSLAKLKMANIPRREADEEDIVLSAMQSFLRVAREGGFPRFSDRDDLWKLLVTITARKVSTQRKRHFAQKRGGGQIRGESVFRKPGDDLPSSDIEEVVGDEPTPDFAVEVAETCRNMLESLDNEVLLQVALLRLEGFTNGEIAKKT